MRPGKRNRKSEQKYRPRVAFVALLCPLKTVESTNLPMSHRCSITFDRHANRQTLLKSTVLALRSSISRDRTILMSDAFVFLILAVDGSKKEFLNDL